MSSHDITVLGFAIILAGLIGTEVTARTGHARVPTFAQVVTRVMRTRTGRVGVLVGWAWLGLHFFAKLCSVLAYQAPSRTVTNRPRCRV
jgi:hypothetical protein